MASEPVKITRINTMPEPDPYQSSTNGESYTVIEIDPSKRTVSVDQEWRTNSTTMDRWQRRTLTVVPDLRPDEDELRDYLNSENGQDLLRAICDEHDIDWDGHNMVGTLTEDGEHALDLFERDVNTISESEWTLWDIEDWLDQANPEDVLLGDSVEENVRVIEEMAERERVVLTGDIREWVEEHAKR